MGNKKKFFDKKKSATFQLLARDSSDPIYEADPTSDRVFVRVDNNPYTIPTIDEDDDDNHKQASDDAVLDNGYNYYGGESRTTPMPDDVRREILELGFPDDGYNYLNHLREIRNTGGGSSYYENPKAKPEVLPLDVKAYDASRLDMSRFDDASEEKAIYTVASKTVNVKVQKALDPEVAALLDDSDAEPAGSDVEDFEEDFVFKANRPEGPVDEDFDKKLSLAEKSEFPVIGSKDLGVSRSEQNVADVDVVHEEKPRVRRLLDEQFDMLELKEYGTESEDDYANYMDAEEDEDELPLAEKLNQAFTDLPRDGFEPGGKFLLPSKSLLHDDKGAEAELLLDSAVDVIHRCKEYGQKYQNEDVDEKVVIYEESSDESEVWDCETIVTQYSNLENHPGKIGAPEGRRKKKLAETVSAALSTPNNFITLKGREKLPVDFLPRGIKPAPEKVKDVNSVKTDQQKRKKHGEESKEEKKERKTAVKEERREARRMKKETKELYKGEAHRAQKVAAFTGPSSIHLM